MVEESTADRKISVWKHLVTAVTVAFVVYLIVLVVWLSLVRNGATRVAQANAAFSDSGARLSSFYSLLTHVCNARRCVNMESVSIDVSNSCVFCVVVSVSEF